MLYRPLNDYEISQQIAGLLNDYNNLSRKRYGPEILEAKTGYVAETHGRLVIGAAGLCKVSHAMSEIKHLVVRPEWRRKGVAKFILLRVISLAATPLMYATIRSDNLASLELFKSAGFTRGQKYKAVDHNVTLLTRTSPTCKTTTKESRSGLGIEPTWTDLKGR